MEAAIGYQPARRPGAGSPGISAVLDVLEVLDREGPTTLADLARETGIAKSTLHRVCSIMFERGWAARDAQTGHIELGPRVAWLAHTAPVSPLTAGFHGVARRLVARHNETTCLTVLDGRDSVFIAKEETTHPVRLVTAVGSRLPAFAAASGRVLLADRPAGRGRGSIRGLRARDPHRPAARRARRAVRDPARDAPPRLRRERRRDRARAALPGGARRAVRGGWPPRSLCAFRPGA